MAKVTRKEKFRDYSRGDWTFTMTTNEDGSRPWLHDNFVVSLLVRQAEASEQTARLLTSVLTRLDTITARLRSVEEGVERLRKACDPVEAAETAKKRKESAASARQQESQQRAMQVYMKSQPVPTLPAGTLTPNDFTLSARARKVLWRLGVTVAAELLTKTVDDLLAVRNCGTSTVKEIQAAMAEHGLSLAAGADVD